MCLIILNLHRIFAVEYIIWNTIMIMILIKIYSLSPLNVCIYALEIKIIEGLENKQYYNTLYIHVYIVYIIFYIKQIYCKFNIELMEKSVIILGLRMLPTASRCCCWCKTVVSRHIEFLLLRWLDNVLDWQKPLPHTGHLKGFSLTCMYLHRYKIIYY